MTNLQTEVIVIGLGSIGERHARLLFELGANVTKISRHLGIGIGNDLSNVFKNKSDALLLVSTETASHAEILKTAKASGHRGPIVVEKPVGLKCVEFRSWKPERPMWVAYNLRYLPVVQAFKKALDKLKDPVLSINIYAGQYLGDWRPDRKISENYSAHIDAGGGVLRDLSHELDLIIWMWGRPKSIVALGGRLGDVTVDSDDSWNILMQSANGINISLGLSYFDRPVRRFIHAVSRSTTILANLIDGTLSINGEVSLHSAERDDSYRAMWVDILNACKKGVEPQACKFEQGLEVMLLIEACENSAQKDVEKINWVLP